ncbi:MAG: hypothetical protein ND866_24415 [Pyrinomonadaceae bacterium]|nr:hypothetical protein [Pyrinomonadaceae bacterium]
MLKRYRFWLWTAVVFLLLTALIHASTLFIQPEPQNETERQLFGLLTSYKQDFGAGFQRSMKELFTALSACYSLVCLLGGFTLGFLMRAKADVRILRGVVAIHVVVFGICFAVMAAFTFLPPIVLTGLIFVSLLVAFLVMPRQGEVSSETVASSVLSRAE